MQPRLIVKRHPGVLAALSAIAVCAASPSLSGASIARLRIPFPQADGTLTPYTYKLGYPLVTLVYDTLMWRDARGIPRPWLARSVRRSGDRVIVRLRRGVRWQDGAPLTAADVVFTYRYVATHPHPRFTPTLSDLVDVEQAGSETIVFTLRSPSLGFEDQPLSDVPILPRARWEGLPADRLAPPGLPVGSGPYRLVAYDPSSGYRFLANPAYFRGTPTVKEIDVPIIRDAQATFGALRDGRVDAVPVELTPQAVDQIGGDLGVRIVIGNTYTGTVLMLNTAAAPFNAVGARRAVAGALDPDTIAAAMGTLPSGPVAISADRGLLDPGSPWASRRSLRTFRPDTARVTLAELGEPPLVILAPNNDPIRLQAGREVVRALRAVGARATRWLERSASAAIARASRRRSGRLPRSPPTTRRSSARCSDHRCERRSTTPGTRAPGSIGSPLPWPRPRRRRYDTARSLTSSRCSRATRRSSRCSSPAARSRFARAPMTAGRTSKARASSTSSHSSPPAPTAKRGGHPPVRPAHCRDRTAGRRRCCCSPSGSPVCWRLPERGGCTPAVADSALASAT
jgi:hypothetical protein